MPCSVSLSNRINERSSEEEEEDKDVDHAINISIEIRCNGGRVARIDGIEAGGSGSSDQAKVS